MSYFTIRPQALENFELPGSLYHSCLTFPFMPGDVQKPVIVGDIPDLSAFRVNQERNKFRELCERCPGASWGFDEEEGVNILPDSKYKLRVISNASDLFGDEIKIPRYFAHHAQLLTQIFSYEKALSDAVSPYLFKQKLVYIEERCIWDFHGIPEISPYSRVHMDDYRDDVLDERGNIAESIAGHRFTQHAYIASDQYSTGYPKRPYEITERIQDKSNLAKDTGYAADYSGGNAYMQPEGKVGFHTGMMWHFASLPVFYELEISPELPRTALIVSFCFDKSYIRSWGGNIMRSTIEQVQRLSRDPERNAQLVAAVHKRLRLD